MLRKALADLWLSRQEEVADGVGLISKPSSSTFSKRPAAMRSASFFRALSILSGMIGSSCARRISVPRVNALDDLFHLFLLVQTHYFRRWRLQEVWPQVLDWLTKRERRLIK